MTVDFVATNASGQPVTDLKPADVSVKIGGKQRAVSSLEFKKAEGGGGGAVSALPAPFAVNSGGAGRNLLILIENDSLKIGTERAVRESLDQVLSQLGPADRVAFSVAPRDTVQLGFGSGLPAVRAAVAKFAGTRPASVTTSEAACRSRDTLVLLRALLDAQAGSEAPTTVVFISAGLSLPTTINRGGDSVTCEVLTEHYQGLANSVAQGRINLYVVQGDDTITGRDNGLENLAGVAGAGGVLRALPGGLTRIVSESSGYWLATVAGDAGDRPGSVTKMELKVTREGVTTRARSDYAVSKAVARPGAKSMTPREMVGTTAAFTDLQMRVTSMAQRGQAGKVQVVAMVEPLDPSTKFTAMTGVLVPPGGAKAAFARSMEEKDLIGRPVVVGMLVDPGKYRLRIAATDANGKAGAVDLDVDAQLTQAGPLQISQIMLLSPRGESYAPQLQFKDEAEIAALIELYGPVATSKVGAKIEIAATADGKALVDGVVGGSGTNEPDKFQLNGKLAIGALPPGDYIVRAVVQVEGQPEGRVTKTLRKLPK